MPWFVLYTKSRNEKIVAKKLQERNIEVYCPLRITHRKWSDRYKKIGEPLFRSYVFVNLSESERNQVFGIPGVVRYLFWLQKPAIVRDEEIEAIRLILNEVDNSQLVITEFQPGNKLRIGSGAFAQTEGTVVRQQGRIVTVLLESLQVIISVDQSKTVVLA